jgi:hypothetical protein
MAEPSGTMKITFAVSATPKIELIQNEGFYQAQTVIHEDIRTSLGGSGEITSDDLNVNGAWVDGVHTAISSGADVALSTDQYTDALFIKHTGRLFDTNTLCSDATTSVLVKSGANIIAELLSGEAIVLPRPSSAIVIDTGSGTATPNTAGDILVDVEVTILGSNA